MSPLQSQSPLTQAEISEVRQEVGGCLYMACGPSVRQQRIDEDQHGDAGQDQQNTADAFRLEEIADGIVHARIIPRRRTARRRVPKGSLW